MSDPTPTLRERIGQMVAEHEQHGLGFHFMCTLCNTKDAYEVLRAALDASEASEGEVPSEPASDLHLASDAPTAPTPERVTGGLTKTYSPEWVDVYDDERMTQVCRTRGNDWPCPERPELTATELAPMVRQHLAETVERILATRLAATEAPGERGEPDSHGDVACAVCLATTAECMAADAGCCDSCRATGGCTHHPDPAPTPRTTEGGERCGAERRHDPNWNSTWIACVLEAGHDGEHFSTSGCAGSEMRWPDPAPAPSGTVSTSVPDVLSTSDSPSPRDESEPGDVEALTLYLARAIHPAMDEETKAVAWVCAKALLDEPNSWLTAHDTALREAEGERIAKAIEDAALHVLTNADSDEGAKLTAAILDRAAAIARGGDTDV